jgi:hypothetical protein
MVLIMPYIALYMTSFLTPTRTQRESKRCVYAHGRRPQRDSRSAHIGDQPWVCHCETNRVRQGSGNAQIALQAGDPGQGPL